LNVNLTQLCWVWCNYFRIGAIVVRFGAINLNLVQLSAVSAQLIEIRCNSISVSCNLYEAWMCWNQKDTAFLHYCAPLSSTFSCEKCGA
jgi:hypothetical protein